MVIGYRFAGPRGLDAVPLLDVAGPLGPPSRLHRTTSHYACASATSPPSRPTAEVPLFSLSGSCFG